MKKTYRIDITVFLCGALGMTLELVAARILSPYVGSSNLIWTTIIGIMLASMSIGYYLGGKIADRKTDINILSLLILIGAIFTSFIPILETLMVKPLSQNTNNLVLIATINSLAVFGIPSFILATVSPFAVKLHNKNQDSVGSTSGRISSLSTIGSIAGTFFSGFVLIPHIGVKTIILVITITLFILSFVIYTNKKVKYTISMFVVLIILIGINIYGKKLFLKYNSDIIEDVDSQYSRIWVKNLGMHKTLQVDTGLEAFAISKTNQMGASYLYFYNLLDYYNKNAKSTLIIGGGAYTYPTYYLNNYKDKKIDVVEIDEKMTEIAEREFGLDVNNERLKIYHQDGRSFLNYTQNKYDIILIDAFKGLNVPFELTTYEALMNAKKRLNDGGIVITNIISSLEGKDSDFIKYEYATYKAVFSDVKIFKVTPTDEQNKQNLILIGFKDKPTIDETKYEQYEYLLRNEITDFESDKKILTDDYTPMYY